MAWPLPLIILLEHIWWLNQHHKLPAKESWEQEGLGPDSPNLWRESDHSTWQRILEVPHYVAFLF